MEFFSTEPIETLIKKRSAFIVNKQQHKVPGKWWDGLYSVYDMKYGKLRGPEDTDGLTAFFEANKANYTWDVPRFKGIIVFAADEKIEKKAKKIIKNSPLDSIPVRLSKLNEAEKEPVIKTTNGLFVKGENKAVDKIVFGEGNYTTPEKLPNVFIAEGSKVLDKGPDSYKDMKGIVLSDYQNYLQEEWIKELRKKYPVVVFEDVLKTIEK